MQDILAQSGFLAQRGDFEGWANILFLVVVAILWLFGALAKTLGKKRPQSDQEGPAGAQRRPAQSWQERLARKAEEIQRRIEEEAGIREPPRPMRKTPPPKSSQQTATTGQCPTKTPDLELALSSTPAVMADRPSPPASEKVQQDASHQPSGLDPAAIIDYNDPDVLKKAILHYEILGRPVSLRDPADQASAF
jgi:hypothetical protein